MTNDETTSNTTSADCPGNAMTKTITLPGSVLSEAMLDDFDYASPENEWGFVPEPTETKSTKNGRWSYTWKGLSPEHFKNLMTVVVSRCSATYACNDDRQQAPIAAWNFLRRNYPDEIAHYEAIGRGVAQ